MLVGLLFDERLLDPACREKLTLCDPAIKNEYLLFYPKGAYPVYDGDHIPAGKGMFFCVILISGRVHG